MSENEVENVVVEDTSSEKNSSKPTPVELHARLMSTAITDENVALNVIVSFLNIAQRRGVFTLDESAKIWECIKIFQR